MAYFAWKYCAVWLTSEAGPHRGQYQVASAKLQSLAHFWTKIMINESCCLA